ncbi:MAG: bifunctional glutamate N-acetyltransferase/amino-acid acetyltransferase ArgJ [Thermoleophilia bacterium]|jgi:glutamate N-acetyltransferase/amino-acid N-acetyltransferase|nr:bifunctional glutamate N-acetyltransferase/amino-acid acetyltransferase ArgJ [Thermoleophilia bacterium]
MLPLTRFVELPDFARQAQRSVTCPGGFAAAGVATGVKKRGKLDLGMLVSERPCVSAATFTGNAAAAAPVRLTRESADCAHLRAAVVNAGNANAFTGKDGLADAARMRLLTAQALRLPVEQVAVASTGVIGVPLEMDKVERGIAEAATALRPGGGEHFSQAIRTTDVTPKRGALELELEGGTVRLGAAAKGCGMISPRMATMLAFVTCDAEVEAEAWRELLRGAVAKSFNRITVDGQESTNDTVLGMANGASGVSLGDAGLAGLGEALDALLLALAVAMVADGEGATKAIRLVVDGARDAAEAERVARAVGTSPLVKTAFYGRDANWGRIVQAVGQAIGENGAAAGPSGAGSAGAAPAAAPHTGASAAGAGVAVPAEILYEDLAVVRGGEPVPLSEGAQEHLADIMAQHEIDVRVVLDGGSAATTLYFSDLTHEYVTMNAEYTT